MARCLTHASRFASRGYHPSRPPSYRRRSAARLRRLSAAVGRRTSYDCPKHTLPRPVSLLLQQSLHTPLLHQRLGRVSTCVASAQPSTASRLASRLSAAGPPAWIEGRRRCRTMRSRERAPRTCRATRRRHETRRVFARRVPCRLKPRPLALRCTPWRGTAQEGSSRPAPWTALRESGISTTCAALTLARLRLRPTRRARPLADYRRERATRRRQS